LTVATFSTTKTNAKVLCVGVSARTFTPNDVQPAE
jgi:hypothetical protein